MIAPPPARALSPVCDDDARFFVTGGSLPEEAPSYVVRRADDELLQALRRGEFCYVLDTRQIGKSSLIVRAAARLRAEGRRVVVLDLSAAGQNVSVEQWYFGLLYSVAAQLGLEDEMEAFWAARSALSPAQRWIAALREVALPGPGAPSPRVPPALTPSGPLRVPPSPLPSLGEGVARSAGGEGGAEGAPLVLFVDEIDAVRGLPFSADEFFAVLRECFNRRTQDSALDRLTFCLVGVATPAQLIRDLRTTPFNIGRRIELTDFTAAEAAALGRGLCVPGRSERTRQALLARVLHWTGGHPYLTQRLCRVLVEDGRARRSADVDRLCAAAFLTRQGKETDPNLTFARDRMLGADGADPASVLLLYARVRAFRSAVAYDPTDSRADVLRLSGLATVVNGTLAVRNRIYARAFDGRWVRENLPGQEVRRQRQAFWRGVGRVSTIWVVVLIALFFAFHENLKARGLSESLHDQFRKLSDAKRQIGAVSQQLRGLDTRRQNAEADLKRLRQSNQGEVQRTQASLHAMEQKQSNALADLSGTRARLAQEQRQGERSRQARLQAEQDARAQKAQALQYALEIGRKNGQVATAFAAQQGSEFTALGFGLRAVEPALAAGEEPDPQSIQGLADAVNTEIVRRLRIKHPAPLLDACWSPDGARFALSAKNARVYIHDSDTGALRQTLVLPTGQPGRENQAWGIAFSPDGRTLATASTDGVVRLWDVASGRKTLTRPVREMKSPAGSPAVAFFPDGKRLVTTVNNTARIWNLGDGSHRDLQGQHEKYVWSVAVSRKDESRKDNLIATAGADGWVKVWDAATGVLVAQNDSFRKATDSELSIQPDPENRQQATAVSFGNDTLLCVGRGTTAFTWTWWRGNEHIHRVYPHPQGILRTGDVSPGDDLLATGSELAKVTLWNRGRGDRPLFTLETHTDDVYAVRFRPDRREFLTASRDRTAEVWTVTQPIFFNTGAAMRHADFSPDGKRLLYAGEDEAGPVWVTGLPGTPGAEQTKVLWGGAAVQWAAFLPNGRRVVTADVKGGVRIWDATGAGNTETPLLRLVGHTALVSAAVFAPDGKRIATASSDNTVRLWDGATGREIARFQRNETRFRSVRFSPNGKLLAAAASDGVIYVLDAQTLSLYQPGGFDGRLIAPKHTYRPDTSLSPYDAAFSPDGRRIASADSDGNIYVWSTQTWQSKPPITLSAAGGEVFGVTFSPDSKRVAGAGADNTVHLWRLADGQPGGTTVSPYLNLRGHSDYVYSVRFSPDGQQIITAGKDGTTRLFPATAHAYVTKAKEILALEPRKGAR